MLLDSFVFKNHQLLLAAKRIPEFQKINSKQIHMKTNLLITLLTILFFSEQTSAQLKFQKTIGGTGSDYGTQIQPTTDNGYILVGTTLSFGAGGYDVYLIKLDNNSDTLWTKTYGGSNNEYGNSVKQTPDGGYIIAGNSTSFGANGQDVYLLKTDSLGNVSWSKLFGGAGTDYGNTVLLTSDGGYLVGGTTQNLGAGNYDAYLIKTDANGNALWTKTYGGSFEENGNFVQQTSDNGFILIGITQSFGAGGVDIYVVKTNATGDTLWTKTYGDALDDFGFSIMQTADNGYILAGATNSFGAGSFDCLLMKTDSNGLAQWTKTYGGTDWENGYSMAQTADDGFIVVGQSYSFGVASDVYVIRTDAAGDTLWTKTYGGNGYDYENCILTTSDGGYLISASEESFGANRNIYLIKTDSAGTSNCNEGGTATIVNSISMTVASTATNVSSGGSTLPATSLIGGGASVNILCTTIGINNVDKTINSVIVFPNPFSTQLTFVLTDKVQTTVTLFDCLGRHILQQVFTSSTTMNTEQLANGIYFYELRNSKGALTTGKIVKQ